MRAEHEECSRRFIAGVAEMNAWRRKRGEGVTPSQGCRTISVLRVLRALIILRESGGVFLSAFGRDGAQAQGARDVQFVARRFVRKGEQSGQDEYDEDGTDERAARDEEGHLLYDEVG